MEHAVSLYIHIPFCLSKCAYCDFYSIPCGSELISDSYIDALLCEAAWRAEINHIDSWATIYVGGGTPSLLTEKQIQRVFAGLSAIAGRKKPREVTFEWNPGDVTPQKLAAAEKAGVTRLSCGIQSFNEKVLKNVSRRSNTGNVRYALECIRRNWHGIFSADIISGLPCETDESFITGLGALLDYAPDHVSLYSLTLEEGTPLGDKIFAGKLSYDSDKADAMWISGRDYLCSNKYMQYEVSNFCRQGKESLHNMAYWKQQDYIGCGAGATGTMYGRKKSLSIRETNTRNIAEYSDFWLHDKIQHTKIPSEIEYITPATAEFEFFMMGLRTSEGICRETYEENFGTVFPQKVEQLFTSWEKKGKSTEYTKNYRHFYALTSSGLLFLNEFLESL